MKNKLLIFDLDETLIHGSENLLERPADFQTGKFYIYERPHVRELMKFCCSHFALAIWTTATPDYAKSILQNILGTNFNDQLEFIWCRDRCTFRGIGEDGESRWIKDLKKVKNAGWNLEHVLIVEDKPKNISRHYGNVIRINPFEGDLTDIELKRILPFLLRLKTSENVRSVEKRGWESRFPL